MDSLWYQFLMIPWWVHLVILIIAVGIYDVFIQKKHTILHNFPVVGHFRYLLESIGPELRQYIVASNREELPFNRSQRSWVYASSKKQNNYQGFGTDQDIHSPGHIFINSRLLPKVLPEDHPNRSWKDAIPSAKVLGEYHKRKRPFRPASIVNISAMSYGSLSKAAVTALNKGAIKAGCYHNTGEGGLSPYHSYGADVVFHFGTGYFGVRDEKGNFSMDKMKALVENNPFIRAIEVKLSQGAKPGKGGVLPGKKITKEIAEIRGVEMGKDVLSPASHSAFSNVEELITFVEEIADATGLPVGIKSAVGKVDQWITLADAMKRRGEGPDFIAIDGGEGGTGAAPPSFANHVSLPFMYAFSEVYRLFEERELTDRLAFIAAGKLGFPSGTMMAFSMGADMINVAREAMMSIGCIQAQICHTNSCPAGVATQKKWLQAGLKPELKSERFSNYVRTLRKEVLEITHACGYEHPTEMNMEDVRLSMGDNHATRTLKEIFSYEKAPVAFSGMTDLLNCSHLGAIAKK
ncbi:MAG: FMN-binding glutamate synthase family protein [Bacteroidota bacterium]